MAEEMSINEYPAPTRFDKLEDPKPYALSGKIMLVAIVILFSAVVLVVALHLYARWYLLRARRRQVLRRRSLLNEVRRASHFVFYVDDNPTTLLVSDPGNQGLQSSVLSSLPVFVYSSKTYPGPVDCAVCLSEFEENEKGRLLPKCNHSFHVECIDMWFQSHSTCPLCRAPVEQVFEPQWCASTLGERERTGIEAAGSSSGICVACQHEEGNSSTTSLASRRKGLDVRIDVPLRNEWEDELTLSSPASGGGFKSPGTRLLSLKMKRILSLAGRKTPSAEGSGTSYGAGTSGSTAELDLEKGAAELPPSLMRR